MPLFKKRKLTDENETRRETDYLQAGVFRLLLFVSVVILPPVFKFYE